MNSTKRGWDTFRESAPGMRFQDRYRRRQRDTEGRWTMASAAYIIAGLALTIAGLLLVPAPGPGWIVAFFGIGLISSEFKPVARAMDRAEVWLRAWGTAISIEWGRASGRERAVVGVVVGIVILAVAYGLFRLFFG